MKWPSNHHRSEGLREPKVYAERDCNKVRHRTDRAAKLHLRSLVESGAVRRGEASTYCCPECHWYHVTSTPQRTRGRKAKVRRPRPLTDPLDSLPRFENPSETNDLP